MKLNFIQIILFSYILHSYYRKWNFHVQGLSEKLQKWDQNSMGHSRVYCKKMPYFWLVEQIFKRIIIPENAYLK